MELRVLGTVTAVRAGTMLELGPQQRRLLVALFVEHGSVVTVDRLLERTYGDAQPQRGPLRRQPGLRGHVSAVAGTEPVGMLRRRPMR